MIVKAFRELGSDGSAVRCRLRAVEWTVWPAFLAQPIVPVLYFYFPWWEVLTGVVALNLIWSTLRTHMVSLQFAVFGMLFVKLKWAVIPIAAIVFAVSHRWLNCALTLSTPVLLPILGEFTSKPAGLESKISKYFMLQLGYADLDDRDPEYVRLRDKLVRRQGAA